MSEQMWFVAWAVLAVTSVGCSLLGLAVQSYEYRKPLGEERIDAGRVLVRVWWVTVPLMWLCLPGWAW